MDTLSDMKFAEIRLVTPDQLDAPISHERDMIDALISQEGINLDRAVKELRINQDIHVDLAVPNAQDEVVLYEFKSVRPRLSELHAQRKWLRQFLEKPFKEAIEVSSGYLYSVARSILKDDQRAQDAVQEAYLRAWQYLFKQFEGESRVRLSGMRTWFKRIVFRVALNVVRDERVLSIGLLPDISESHYCTTHPFEQPETAFLHKESQVELSALLEELPEKQKQVVILYYLYDQSVKDIAETLGCEPSTIRSHLSLGRDKLRKVVQKRQIRRGDIDVWSTTSLRDGTLWQFMPYPKDSSDDRDTQPRSAQKPFPDRTV